MSLFVVDLVKMSELTSEKVDFQLGGSSSSSANSIPDLIQREESNDNNKFAVENQQKVLVKCVILIVCCIFPGSFLVCSHLVIRMQKINVGCNGHSGSKQDVTVLQF